MLYAPFSVALNYSAPDGKGVYLYPTSEAAPNGWGEPRRTVATATEPSTRIDPGTKGGPFPFTLLSEKTAGWKASSLKQFQGSGNITWQGEWRNPSQQAKGRHILSYFGPKLRYFIDEGFVYGNLQAHNEVYYLGGIAAIATGPVLGACIRTMSFFDVATQTTKDTKFIIVAVLEGGNDVFYKKVWPGTTIRPDKLTDAVREEAMKAYDAADAPFGWMPMGVVAKLDGAYTPETPWFFNRSGTEAATMRRKNLTFNNGADDVTEDFFNRYKVTIGTDSISFSNAGNLAPMQYKEKYTKEQVLGYTSVDHEGYNHTWDEDHVKVAITLTGAHYVMCDYRGDTLIYGKVKYYVNRIQEEYYTVGKDAANYKNEFDQNISNQTYAKYLGPHYFDIARYGYTNPAYVIAVADHNWTTWIGVTETIKFYYGPENDDEESLVELHYYDSGTSDEWAGNPRQPDNPYIYYYFFSTRWLEGFSEFRDHLGFLAYDFTKYNLYKESNGTFDRTEKHKTTLYSTANPTGEDLKSTKKQNSTTISFGWLRAEMETWSATFSQELSRTTYTGAWAKDNDTGQTQKPGSRTFYDNDASGDVKADWPTIGRILYGENNVCRGNGIVTEHGKIAYSVEVPDKEDGAEGKYVLLSDMPTVGKLASLVGFGEKFYPVGTC